MVAGTNRKPPSLDFAFRVEVDLEPILDFGQTPAGRRRVIGIRGGKVTGPRCNGRILPGGADWQIIWGDGTAYVEARYSIETDGGGLIYVQNFGYRSGPRKVIARLAAGEAVDRSEYYFRTSPRFETSHPDYEWMNRTIFVGDAARLASGVVIDFFAVA